MEPSSMNETKIGKTEPKRSVTPTDEMLAAALRNFCTNFKFVDIMSRLQTCLRRETSLSLAYISLRLECNEYRVSRDFKCIDHRKVSGSAVLPEIVDHPDGFEFSLIVQDTDSKTGQLNFGIYHHDAGQFNSEQIKLIIAKLIQAEIRNRDLEPNCFQDEEIAKFIHRVRNPLATILVSSSQLSINDTGVFSEDDRQLAEYISSEAERIDKMLTEYAQTASASRKNCRASFGLGGFAESADKKLSIKRNGLKTPRIMREPACRSVEKIKTV